MTKSNAKVYPKKCVLRERCYGIGKTGNLDLLNGPRTFWVFNAQLCILQHSRDSFCLTFVTHCNALVKDEYCMGLDLNWNFIKS